MMFRRTSLLTSGEASWKKPVASPRARMRVYG
jgi:hypothetical protein